MLRDTQIVGMGCEELKDADAEGVSGGFLNLLLPALGVGYGLWKAFDAAIGGRAAINERACDLNRQIREQQDARIGSGMLDGSTVTRP